MYVVLDGFKIQDEDLKDFKKATITISKDSETGKPTKSIGSGITFINSAYEYIRKRAIDSDSPLFEGRDAEFTFDVYDDCCNDDNGNDFLLFQGVIRGDTIDWCEGICEVGCTAVERNEIRDFEDCFKSTIIFDNTLGFMERDWWKFRYCDEIRPGFLQILLVTLCLVVYFLFLAILPLILSITVIFDILKFFGRKQGNQKESFNASKDVIEWARNLDELCISCGRGHVAPRVIDYIQNVCDVCNNNLNSNIQFNSSILNDPSSNYFDMHILSAPVNKGKRNDNLKLDPDNAPIETGQTLLDRFKEVFNALWFVRDNELIFERYDFFYNNAPVINIELIRDRLVGEFCWRWTDKKAFAYGDLRYKKDGEDWVGNEAYRTYSGLFEWNSPYSPKQEDKFDKEISFSPIRFRHDGIGEDDNDKDILKRFENAPFIGKEVKEYRKAITFNTGVFTEYKLVIRDPNSNPKNATVREFDVDAPKPNRVNFPLQFNNVNVAPNTAIPTNNNDVALYKFYSIENPRVFNDQGLEFDFKFQYTCEELRNLSIFNLIETKRGTGRIKDIKINLADNTIEISGEL